MKSIVIVFALAVCACGEGATILSSDGSKTLGYCGAGYWTSCVQSYAQKDIPLSIRQSGTWAMQSLSAFHELILSHSNACCMYSS